MRLPRRSFLGLIPVSALSLRLGGRAMAGDGTEAKAGPLITSPPVVQHPSADGFTVHFAVSGLATGWVEWGWSPDRLDNVAIAAEHGLVCASDLALGVRVRFDEPIAPGKPVYYRVVAQPLAYQTAYKLQRGEPEASQVQKLVLPSDQADEVTIAIVNDTHENRATLDALHKRLAELEYDVLLWNGDT